MKKLVLLTLFALVLTACGVPDNQDVQATLDALVNELAKADVEIAQLQAENNVQVEEVTPEPTPVVPTLTLQATATPDHTPTPGPFVCPLERQYWDEMMHGGTPSKNVNNGSPVAWGNLLWSSGGEGGNPYNFSNDPIVIEQNCQLISGYWLRNPNVSFEAVVGEDGLSWVACTMYFTNGTGTHTRALPCYQQMRNVETVKSQGSVETDAYRFGFCIYPDKWSGLSDEGCKFPTGNPIGNPSP